MLVAPDGHAISTPETICEWASRCFDLTFESYVISNASDPT
jgi:hypothetical protein